MYELPAVAAMMPGPMSFVTDAPTLPAPNTPKARPLRSWPNQAEFHDTPTLNRLPAKPTRKARTRSQV